MTSTFIIVSILEVAAVALIITGFVFEKKLINFEEKFETALAKKIAHFLCTNKYTKAHFVKEKKTAQRRSADCVRARDRLSDSRQKGQQSCLIFFENRISLTALPFGKAVVFTLAVLWNVSSHSRCCSHIRSPKLWRRHYCSRSPCHRAEG